MKKDRITNLEILQFVSLSYFLSLRSTIYIIMSIDVTWSVDRAGFLSNVYSWFVAQTSSKRFFRTIWMTSCSVWIVIIRDELRMRCENRVNPNHFHKKMRSPSPSLTIYHQIQICSLWLQVNVSAKFEEIQSSTERFCSIWKYSLEAFLRYRVHKSGTDGWTDGWTDQMDNQ